MKYLMKSNLRMERCIWTCLRVHSIMVADSSMAVGSWKLLVDISVHEWVEE